MAIIGPSIWSHNPLLRGGTLHLLAARKGLGLSLCWVAEDGERTARPSPAPLATQPFEGLQDTNKADTVSVNLAQTDAAQ
jgi:hypothetical protein